MFLFKQTKKDWKAKQRIDQPTTKSGHAHVHLDTI